MTGERLTVAAPFFNRWMLPIGLILLTLTGIGPLLAWRKSTVSNLVYQLKWPVLAVRRHGGSALCAWACASGARARASRFQRWF